VKNRQSAFGNEQANRLEEGGFSGIVFPGHKGHSAQAFDIEPLERSEIRNGN